MKNLKKLLGSVLTLITICLISILVIKNTDKNNQQKNDIMDYGDFVRSNPELFLLDENVDDSIINYFEKDNNMHIVTATVYNPVSSQCDDTPLITADQSKIDLEKLNSGELRWIAISRELREFYGYGSTVKITCLSDTTINGLYEVHDTMNKRYNRTIDILVPTSQKYGKWNNVIIEKN